MKYVLWDTIVRKWTILICEWLNLLCVELVREILLHFILMTDSFMTLIRILPHEEHYVILSLKKKAKIEERLYIRIYFNERNSLILSYSKANPLSQIDCY